MSGHLTVISGCMFSGKTIELLKHIRLAQYRKKSTAVYKPFIDNRYSETEVASHVEEIRMKAKTISRPRDILLDQLDQRTDIVGVDEIQFFNSEEMVESCKKLLLMGTDVILAGLNQDSNGIPFGAMPTVLALSDNVIHLNAVCVICQGIATKTYRKSANKETIHVGGKNDYDARCTNCWSNS